MKNTNQAVAFGIGCFAALLATMPAAAQPMQMATLGGTSQPVGHYEFCQRYPAECQRNPTNGVVKLTRGLWAKIVDINNSVNISIFPRTDQEMFGVPEVWSYPSSEGDCEDYVLLKRYMLEREGLPRSALLITVVRQPNGDGHAVLTVRTDQGEFVLDNLDDRVLVWSDTDYRYLKRQSEKDSGRWIGIADDRSVLVGSVR